MSITRLRKLAAKDQKKKRGEKPKKVLSGPSGANLEAISKAIDEELQKGLEQIITRDFNQSFEGPEVKITIGNSFSQISGYSQHLYQKLQDALTYDNEEAIFQEKDILRQMAMAKRMRHGGRFQYLRKQLEEVRAALKVCWLRDDQFPTGLLFLVEETLKDWGAKYTLENSREVPKPKVALKWKRAPFPLRYYQEEMVELAIEKHRGVFEAAVGAGKTRIAEEIIMSLKVPTLFVVPSRDLAVQTYDDFARYFGSSRVEMITSQKVKSEKKLAPIRIVTIQTLGSLNKKNGLDHLIKDLDCIICDEIHHAGSTTYTSLLKKLDHVYFRFGLSGTFLRNDSKTLDMWGFLSGVLYKYPASKAIAEGYLTPLEVLVHTLPGRRKSNYQYEYKANYCGNPDLYEKILEIITSYAEPDAQILVLVNRKDTSGAVLHDFLKRHGVENTYISGDDKKDVVKAALKGFNEKTVRVLLGSTIIGEGIDIRSTDHIIMAQGGKSPIAITQATGRAVRLFPGKKTAFLHDFRMLNTKYMEKHLDKRLEIYLDNFAAKIEDVNDY